MAAGHLDPFIARLMRLCCWILAVTSLLLFSLELFALNVRVQLPPLLINGAAIIVASILVAFLFVRLKHGPLDKKAVASLLPRLPWNLSHRYNRWILLVLAILSLLPGILVWAGLMAVLIWLGWIQLSNRQFSSALVVLAFVVIFAAVIFIEYRLLRANIRAGMRAALRRWNCCVVCGYDLRSSPIRCPECGTAPRTNVEQ